MTVQEKIISSVTRDPNDPSRVTFTSPTGFGVIHDSKGYTETHVIKARAFDSAGNQAESAPIRIFVSHEEGKGPKPRASLEPPRVAALPRLDEAMRRSLVPPSHSPTSPT